MTKEQKEKALQCIHRAQDHLQMVANGQSPYTKNAISDLSKRREQADWELEYLFKHLAEFLPQALLPGIQACFDLNEHIWSNEYLEAFWAQFWAQKKARSESLATTNEPEVKPC